jgi:hypothetical protein
MGRPLNKKYFGARNASASGTYNRAVEVDAGIGGSSIASIATGGTLTGYTSGAPSLSIFGPKLANGVSATAVPVLTAAAASVTTGGTGYPASSTFTVSVTGSAAQGGGTAVLNVTTNGSGVITTVNSVTSGGTWTGATSGASALTAVGSTFTAAATFTLTSFTITSYSVTNAGDGYIDSADTKSMSILSTDGSGNVTVSSVDEMIVGMAFTPSQSIGGLTGGTTYYVKSVNTATDVVTLSSSVTGAGVGTLKSTTAQPNSAALAAVSQSGGALTFTATTTALPIGTAIAVTGTLTGNLTGVTTGTTYYVSSAVSPTTTAVTLADTYAHAIAGTNSITVGGSTSTGLTFTYTVKDTVTIAGYTPVVSLSSGSATATATLAAQVSSGYTGRYEQIIVNANIGGTLYTDCDIIKQEGSRTYRVIQQGGTYPGTLCKLTAVGEGSLTSGQMAIIATDSAGGTYAVSKLTNRKAYLTPITGTQFTTGQAVPWNLTSPTLNSTVTIDNS